MIKNKYPFEASQRIKYKDNLTKLWPFLMAIKKKRGGKDEEDLLNYINSRRL